jgi:DHA1 family bicyclomycin/chloramphenicol resistance-like MFS transporter
VVSGLLAPLLFDSAFKLACGVLAGLALSWLCWLLAGVYRGRLLRGECECAPLPS